MNNDNDQPTRPEVPRAVLDPELPEDTKALLRHAERHPIWAAGKPISPWWDAQPAIGWGAAGATVTGLAWWFASTVDRPDDPSPNQAFHIWIADMIESALPVVMMAGGLLATYVVFTVLIAGGDNDKLRIVAESEERWVRPKQLTDDAQALLVRAQRAADTILGSSVHRLSLLDRPRNEVMLPEHEWEIATGLRDYSRLVEQEPATPRSEKVTELLGVRRKALDVSRDSIERRVTALEAYADQVTEADATYEELQQIQQLSDGSSDVLDLLARTARDDLAAAELDSLTGEAAVVAKTFARALETAKRSAVAALPPLRKGA
ncbi:hypothetical protein [Streptomyces lasiicapitis]|uniref:hypothetical protein n=1 Tax=Streptomyces lasiicapitis TaxID=1923961 RepID=UPI0016656647|nr:hypothetical protein [Streptomyces lasiicapitis]